MCGRFVQFSAPEIYIEQFRLARADSLPPRYNVAPSQPVLAVRVDTDGARELTPLRWGLVPAWSQGPDSRYGMINARAETVHAKPAYRAAFKTRRCLVPTEGFYEWRTLPDGKQPYFSATRERKPFAMAGLWERWRDPQGNPLDSCTIVVTDANETLQSIHNRMPVIIRPRDYQSWLDPENQDSDRLRSLLRRDDRTQWTLAPVSRKVNSPRNEGPDLIEPVAI